jgi:hypothetical protein
MMVFEEMAVTTVEVRKKFRLAGPSTNSVGTTY